MLEHRKPTARRQLPNSDASLARSSWCRARRGSLPKYHKMASTLRIALVRTLGATVANRNIYIVYRTHAAVVAARLQFLLCFVAHSKCKDLTKIVAEPCRNPWRASPRRPRARSRRDRCDLIIYKFVASRLLIQILLCLCCLTLHVLLLALAPAGSPSRRC
jgi:hypothetical protein